MKATAAVKFLDPSDPGSLDAYITILRKEVTAERLGQIAMRDRKREVPQNPDAVYCIRVIKAHVNDRSGASVAFLCDGSARVLRCSNNNFKCVITRKPTDRLTWNTACLALSFMYTSMWRESIQLRRKQC